MDVLCRLTPHLQELGVCWNGVKVGEERMD